MITTLLSQSIHFSTVFLYGSTGETVVEKGGHLNLGIPGIMCFGAVGGCIGEVMYFNACGLENANGFLAILIGILMSLLFAGLLGLLYSFFTITLRCNQNVTGLTITTFGSGILGLYGGLSSGNKAIFATASRFFTTSVFPFYDKLGWFGKIFLSHGLLVYLAIILSIVIELVLKKTRVGLNLRAVGENPAAADAAGISVIRYKYVSSILGASISGLSGLFYLMDHMHGSLEYSIDAMGWLAVALVIFSVWRPTLGIIGSMLFAFLYLAPNYFTFGLPKDIIKMLPYVVTLLVLIVISFKKSKENQPPAGLGVSYFREDR